MTIPLSAYYWIFSIILIITKVIIWSLSSDFFKSMNSLIVIAGLNGLLSDTPLTRDDELLAYYGSSCWVFYPYLTPDLLILFVSTSLLLTYGIYYYLLLWLPYCISSNFGPLDLYLACGLWNYPSKPDCFKPDV